MEPVGLISVQVMSDVNRITRRNNYNNEIQLQRRLDENEETFNNMLHYLERAGQEDPAFNNRDTRRLVSETFDALRDATLDILDSQGSNSESGVQQQSSPVVPAANDGSVSLLPVEANAPDGAVSVHADPNAVFAQLEAYASSCRSNSQVTTEPTSRTVEDLSSSFETLTFHGSDDDVSIAGPISQRYDESVPDVETSPAEPTVATATTGLGGRILAMLRRMGQRLMGFFRWLLNKIKQAAIKVWNAVCEAFSRMFNFLRNLGRGVQDNGRVLYEELPLDSSVVDHLQHRQLARLARASSYGSVLHYRHVRPSWRAVAKFHTI